MADLTGYYGGLPAMQGMLGTGAGALNPGDLSPDGKYIWDGSSWGWSGQVPNPYAQLQTPMGQLPPSLTQQQRDEQLQQIANAPPIRSLNDMATSTYDPYTQAYRDAALNDWGVTYQTPAETQAEAGSMAALNRSGITGVETALLAGVLGGGLAGGFSSAGAGAGGYGSGIASASDAAYGALPEAGVGAGAGIGAEGVGAGLGAGSVPAASAGMAGWGPAVGTIGAGPPAAAAAAGGLAGLGLPGWLTIGSLAAGALQGTPDQTTTSTNEPPAYLKPYLGQAASAAQQQFGQGAYVSPLQQKAVDYGTKVLGGDYLNSNPYLDETFNRAAGAVTNQVQSNFAGAGRNPTSADAAANAQYGYAGAGGGYNDLAARIYGGNYQAERDRQQQILPMTNQLGTIGNPTTALDDYIARLRNLAGGYGTQTSSTPTQSNLYSGLAGLGLALIPGG